MSEHVVCAQCGADDHEVVFEHAKRHLANGFCRRCGLGYLSPRPSEEENELLYAGYRQAYPDDFLADPYGPFASVGEERASFVAGWLAPGSSVLEVGCGYGHFMRSVGDRGFAASGLEPSPHQRRFAAERLGVGSIADGGIDDVERGGGFDLAAMFHVIEHLRDPQQALHRLARAVRPGGLVFLDLPDATGLPCDAIEHLYIVEGHHLYSFTPRVLVSMAARAGLETLYVARHPLRGYYTANLRLLARRVTDGVTGPEPKPEETRSHLRAHHDRLTDLGERIRARWTAWRAAGRRVAIYGGGQHTLGLLDLCGLDAGDVACLIDDDAAKHGERLADIPICGPESLADGQIDAVLVSSLAAERAILEKLRPFAEAGIEVQGIYGGGGFGNGTGRVRLRRYTQWMRPRCSRSRAREADVVQRPDLGLEVR